MNSMLFLHEFIGVLFVLFCFVLSRFARSLSSKPPPAPPKVRETVNVLAGERRREREREAVDDELMFLSCSANIATAAAASGAVASRRRRRQFCAE
jgi:hypothetical protein